ncbi:hypothetical protein ACIQF6_00535 [Kitasatospora sp. NPDC092948]|uniref:hypothetical protein n=1 Tax=Kitasatospora sp. NPDC092948 TaxID=3364088 RepID=UPI00380E526F
MQAAAPPQRSGTRWTSRLAAPTGTPGRRKPRRDGVAVAAEAEQRLPHLLLPRLLPLPELVRLGDGGVPERITGGAHAAEQVEQVGRPAAGGHVILLQGR